MIYTSCYSNVKRLPPGLNLVCTSIGSPRGLSGYRHCNALKPTKEMAFGGMDFQAFRQAYLAKLDAIHDPQKLLEWLGRDPILLCFEDITKVDVWCHRTLAGAWFVTRLGIEVRELAPGEAPGVDPPKGLFEF